MVNVKISLQEMNRSKCNVLLSDGNQIVCVRLSDAPRALSKCHRMTNS